MWEWGSPVLHDLLLIPLSAPGDFQHDRKDGQPAVTPILLPDWRKCDLIALGLSAGGYDRKVLSCPLCPSTSLLSPLPPPGLVHPLTSLASCFSWGRSGLCVGPPRFWMSSGASLSAGCGPHSQLGPIQYPRPDFTLCRRHPHFSSPWFPLGLSPNL